MNRRWQFLSIAVLAAVPAFGQNVIGAKSGVINWVEGDVFLADKPYAMQPSQFGEVKENMVLRTEEGRAEVLLPPGVFFRVAEKSSFKMISNRLIDTRVELLTGSAILEIADLAKEATVTLVCKDATVSLTKAGVYRFDTEPAQIKVFKGTAEVAMGGENVSVAAGKMLVVGPAAAAEKFNAIDTDSFDHWSRRRSELLANANISAAKQANANGYGYGSADPCYGYGGNGGYGPYARPWGTWGYNPYYGLGTYIPCQGTMISPYGYRYWSPFAAYQMFYSRPIYTSGGGGGYAPTYRGTGGTSTGSTGAASSMGTGGFRGGSSAAAGGFGGGGAGGGGGMAAGGMSGGAAAGGHSGGGVGGGHGR